MATRRQREIAWQKTPKVRGKNPNLYRRDVYGNVGACRRQEAYCLSKLLVSSDNP